MIQSILPSLTVLLTFACLVAYEYIRDLRRDLKGAREEAIRAWKIYERTNNELLTLQGKPVPEPFFAEDRAQKAAAEDVLPQRGFRPGRIGPTAILDRELTEGRVDAGLRTPMGKKPTPEQTAAAIKAVNRNGSND